MSIATRCPKCNTLFRVTPQALQARQGEVRCGRCMTVFDGFGALVTLPDAPDAGATAPSSAPTRAPTPEPVAAAPSPVPEPVAAASNPSPEPVATAPAPVSAPVAAADSPATTDATPVAPPPAEVAAPPEVVVDHVADSTAESPTASPSTDADLDYAKLAEPAEPGAAGRDAGLAVDAAAAADSAVLPAAKSEAGVDRPSDNIVEARPDLVGPFLPADSPPPRSRRWWLGGTLLLAAGLVLHAAYVFRSDIIARYPAARPVALTICAELGCSVPLPQRPKLINIEATDLQLVDPARPGLIQLTATLRNHAGYDVGYPALDLVLTNKNEHTLARRIFLPADYVERGHDPHAGMPANAEITVRLNLDTGDLGAAGFRLDLLAAP